MRRPSVLVALLLVAAVVAAILVLGRSGVPRPAADVESLAREGTDASAPNADRPPDTPAADDRAPTPPEGPARPAAKVRFTVAVSPLILATTDQSAAAVFRSIHAALLAELRSTSNLDLVELPADPGPAARDVDFDLRVKGESRPGQRASSVLRVYWSATRGGAGDWSASTDPSIPGTSETIARAAADALRRFPFPPDIGRPVELEGVMLDANRSDEERNAALAELKTIPQRFAFVGHDERRIVSVAAADIVANSMDPDVRASVWRAMRKADDPYLVGPLVDSVLRDDSELVRLEAVITLSNSFSHDAKAVAALEYALVHDLSPQVRVNARWASLDENSRRGYVAGTLLRDDLTDAARLELLTAGVSGLRGYIDRPAMQALLDIASRARPSAQVISDDSAGRVNAADLVPLLVDLLRDDGREEIRSAAATALLRHRGETGARETLELALCDDPSERVRNLIAYGLRRSQSNCREHPLTGAAGGPRPSRAP